MKRIFGWVLLVIACGASDANETTASETSGDETAYAALDAPANEESTDGSASVESDATDTTTTDATTSTTTSTATDATTSTTTDATTSTTTDATTSTTTDATTSTTTTTTLTTTTDDSSCTRNADCPRGTRCLCVAGGVAGPDGNTSCVRRFCGDPRHPPRAMP